MVAVVMVAGRLTAWLVVHNTRPTMTFEETADRVMARHAAESARDDAAHGHPPGFHAEVFRIAANLQLTESYVHQNNRGTQEARAAQRASLPDSVHNPARFTSRSNFSRMSVSAFACQLATASRTIEDDSRSERRCALCHGSRT